MLLAVLTLAVVQGQIHSGPLNIAETVGSRAYFNCTATIPTSDDRLAWKYQPVGGSAGGEKIYDSVVGLIISDKFEVDVDKTAGKYNLVVKDVQMSLGVQYWCTLVLADDVASADLVSVEEMSCPPVADVEYYEGSFVNMSCSVNYHGYTNPILDWLDPEGKVLSSQMVVTNSTHVVAFMNMTLEGKYDDQPFMCRLSFTTSSRVTSRTANAPATNIPSYENNCNTTFLVIHPVSEVFIDLTDDIVNPGQTINCSANGRPEPEYQWIGPEGLVVEGDILEITEGMVDFEQPVTFTCVAINVITMIPYRATANVTFTVESENAAQVASAGVEGWVIAVAVVVPIVVIAIAAIAGYCFYKHRSTKGDKPKSSSNGTTSSTPFISPYAANPGNGAPPPSNRYPPSTTTNNSAFVPVTRAAPTMNGTASPGHGDLGGTSLGGSTGRIYNQPPAPATAGYGAGRGTPGSHHSSGTSTPTSTHINPALVPVSLRPNPMSPTPRAGNVNPNPMPRGPIYSPVSHDPRPPSVASSSSRTTSNYQPSVAGAGSARLNMSSAHGSIV